MIRVGSKSTKPTMARTSYSIKEAASQLGVAPITLKRWLLDGRVPEVSRDRNGWRVFDEEDLRRLAVFAKETIKPGDIEATRQPDARKRTLVSLFSGIGGFELGFEQAGFETVLQCEINPFCLDLLELHWPKTPRLTNIKELSSADLPVSDVWVAGFPCQDVSLARMGRRDGLKGKKSSLFYDFARLVGESRPRVLVVENVPGLLSSHQGRDFATVVGTLAEFGYSVGWRVVNSRFFGVPQSRGRVYIVGCYRDWRGPATILFEPECREGDAAPGEADGKKPLSPFKRIIEHAGKEGPVTQSIAYCLYACSARHTGTDWSRTYVSYPGKGDVRRLIPTECEAVMGFPAGWTIPDTKSKFAMNPDLDSLRYYALGNAVTPPVAAWLAHRVSAYLESADEESDGAVAACAAT